MHGAEMLVPYFIADRLREARQASLAKLAVAAREEQAKSRNDASPPAAPVDDRSWMPRLRGYPIDPYLARSSR